MANIAFAPGETEIDNWTLNYLPPSGGRLLGKLVITDQNIYFEGDFDVTIVGTSAVTGGVQIQRANIATVAAVKKFFILQQVHVTLNDGSLHIFDRGMMSAAPLIAALGG